MIIVISGPSGSGKTTVAKSLALKYGLKFVSAGQIFREMARSQGIDVISLNREAENSFDIDKAIDQEIIRQASKSNVVIESHIAGWLLAGKSDLSVYLWAPIEERARRISIRDGLSYEDAMRSVIEREQSHYLRFWRYYGIDIQDLSVYDLVINTTKLFPEGVVKTIESFLAQNIRTPLT